MDAAKSQERLRVAVVEKHLETLRANGLLTIRPVQYFASKIRAQRHNPYQNGVKKYEMGGRGIYRRDWDCWESSGCIGNSCISIQQHHDSSAMMMVVPPAGPAGSTVAVAAAAAASAKTAVQTQVNEPKKRYRRLRPDKPVALESPTVKDFLLHDDCVNSGDQQRVKAQLTIRSSSSSSNNSINNNSSSNNNKKTNSNNNSSNNNNNSNNNNSCNNNNNHSGLANAGQYQKTMSADSGAAELAAAKVVFCSTSVGDLSGIGDGGSSNNSTPASSICEPPHRGRQPISSRVRRASAVASALPASGDATCVRPAASGDVATAVTSDRRDQDGMTDGTTTAATGRVVVVAAADDAPVGFDPAATRGSTCHAQTANVAATCHTVSGQPGREMFPCAETTTLSTSRSSAKSFSLSVTFTDTTTAAGGNSADSPQATALPTAGAPAATPVTLPPNWTLELYFSQLDDGYALEVTA